MSTYRILPQGKQFQIVETDGGAGTLTVRDFATKADARQWIRDKKPMQAEVIRWRDRLPWHMECAA